MRQLLSRWYLVPAVLAFVVSSTHAQTPSAATPAPPAEGQKLRVFLDCEWRCDFDYLRTEIRFVDYVRDRQDADIHVLVTTQATGAGGTEFALQFVGQRQFQGVVDELRYASLPTDSQDQVRQGMSRVLKGGLVRYAMRTPLGEQLQLSFGPAVARPGGASRGEGPRARDPWNNWVFRTRVGGFTNGESTYGSHSLDGSVSASRTTEGWRTSASVSTRYRQSDFEVGERTVTNIQRDHNVSGLLVKSVSEHWSAGARVNANHSTFLNRDLSLRLAPAIEYNVFPYSESTRRELTFQYSVGGNQIDYDQTTIFGKSSEALLDETLVTSYNVKQRWGSVRTSLEGSHYLHDVRKYRAELSGNVELKLVRGVGINLFGSTERIRDQLHIAAGKLSAEQILLRQRQIATAYRYFGSVGLTYSFGSIFNSVVNPRMGGSGGGNVIFF